MIDFKQIKNTLVITSNIIVDKYKLYNVYEDTGSLLLRVANANHLFSTTYKATHIALNDCDIGEDVILTDLSKLCLSLLTGFPILKAGELFLGQDGNITDDPYTSNDDIIQSIGFRTAKYLNINIKDNKTNLDEVYNAYEIYELITSGTSGTVTIPASATILLDKYPDAGDCLITRVDNVNKPFDDPARNSSKEIVTGTLDISGNYNLSSTPQPYPVAIVFQIKLPVKDFEKIQDVYLNRTEFYSANEVSYDNSLSNLTGFTVQEVVDEIQNDNKGIQFDITDNTIPVEGELKWNSDVGTFQFGLAGGIAVQDIGQEILLRARASDTNHIDGDAVFISDATGNVVEASLADASVFTNACRTLAVCTEPITQNQQGYYCAFGLVRNVNTSSFVEGDELFLGANGKLTNVMPVIGNLLVRVGIVTRSHATKGIIFVSIQIKDCATQSFLTKDPTGFYEPQNVIITANGDRTVTLSGTVLPFYRNRLVNVIHDGWVSPVHDDLPAVRFFLTYDGETVRWLNLNVDFFDFTDLLIAYAFYDSKNSQWVYTRECHGVMNAESHREFHQVVGTYRQSGGSLSDFVLNSTVATNRRPSISASLLYDEDLPTTNQALASGGLYTRLYLTGAGLGEFDIDQTEIVNLLTNQPYYNEFNGTDWVQTLVSNNQFMAIWIIAIPMALGSSQKYRYVFMQGQQSGSLSFVQGLSVSNLNLGNFTVLLPESVFIGKIIIRYSGNNWTITEVNDLFGSRSQQLLSPSGNFLSSITVDNNNLIGLGTTSSMLKGVIKDWITANSYYQYNTVINDSKIYRVVNDYISDATIDDDIIAGNLELIGGMDVTYTGTAERTVGGITENDVFTNATMTEMWDALIKEEKFPTLTPPSSTFTASISGLREVGEVINVDFTSSFNRGSINPQYTALSPFRSGLPNEYVFTGTGLTNQAKTDLTDAQSITGYTVLINGQSWTGSVAYDEGVQPKSSYDNDFDSPLPAGLTNNVTRTITGVLPFFATTSDLVTLTKQGLQTHGSIITKTFIAEDGVDKQKLEVPLLWGVLSKIEQYNTLSGQWDTISSSSFTVSDTTQTINSVVYDYRLYTHNMSTIGNRQLRFTF